MTAPPFEPNRQSPENSGFRGLRLSREVRERLNPPSFARECAAASTITEDLTQTVRDLSLGRGRMIDFARRYYEDEERSEQELLDFSAAFQRSYITERLGIVGDDYDAFLTRPEPVLEGAVSAGSIREGTEQVAPIWPSGSEPATEPGGLPEHAEPPAPGEPVRPEPIEPA